MDADAFAEGSVPLCDGTSVLAASELGAALPITARRFIDARGLCTSALSPTDLRAVVFRSSTAAWSPE